MIKTDRTGYAEINKRFISLVGNFYHSSVSRHRMHDDNIKKMKNIISYLKRLKNEGKINDEEFSTLVTHTYAGFVENQFSIIFERALGKTLNRLFGD